MSGVVLLVAMDKVYETVSFSRLRLHSAGTVLTGFLFFAYFAAQQNIFISVLFLKLVLYAGRKFNVELYRSKIHPLASVTRIIAGFFLPPVLFHYFSPGSAVFIFLFITTGELLDRCEFFLEMNIPTPQNQIDTDMLND